MVDHTTLNFTFIAKDKTNTPNIIGPTFNDGFSCEIISLCKIPSNTQLKPLSRSEGGVCSDDERRQIRFGFEYSNPTYTLNKKYIIQHTVRNGIWTKEELDDIIQASISAMKKKYAAYDIKGKIVGERFLSRKKTAWD